MTPRDALAMAAVLACALGMLLLLRLYRKLADADGEWTRKLAHIGTGLLSISLPWIFSKGLPVFIICGASIALLLAILLARSRHWKTLLVAVALLYGARTAFRNLDWLNADRFYTKQVQTSPNSA